MTEDNFIALHYPTGQLNIAGKLHLNINPTGIGNEGVISSAIVHTSAYSLNGDLDITDIESVLSQVETIRFTFNDTDFELVVISPTFYVSTNPFYYYTVEPVTVSDVYDSSLSGSPITDISLTPFLINQQFGFSEFNPLISNASEGRKSKILSESDRLETAVNPANIQALLTETAQKASIQDSMYYDTGWSNSRYGGSKTTKTDNGGVQPAITGRNFTGELFAADTDTDYICNLKNRLRQEFFHDSDKVVSPDFLLASGSNQLPVLRYVNNTNTALQPSTTIITFVNTPVEDYQQNTLQVGNIITPLRTHGNSPNFEFMEIVNLTNSGIEVIRDVYSTRVADENGLFDKVPANTDFFSVDPLTIFRLETTGQRSLNLSSDSKVYVDGTNTILTTQRDGLVVSSSLCPVFLNIVD